MLIRRATEWNPKVGELVRVGANQRVDDRRRNEGRHILSNSLIYVATVLIWGTTWLAISYQLGSVPLEVSVFYRYAAAAVLLLAFCALTGRRLRYSLRQHRLFAGAGALLFCLNYLLAYGAQLYISSAINAVIFSCILWLNILNARLFLGVKSGRDVLAGAVLGMVGIGMLFWPSLSTLQTSQTLLIGGGLSLLGALSASLGNVLSQHSLTTLPVLQLNAWGMTWGAGFNLVYCLALGRTFSFELTPAYVGSLVYLVLFGSIAGFLLYLTLVGRMGAHRAGYVVVMFPVVATLAAMAFEGLAVTGWLVAGMALILTGNVLILRRGKKTTDSDLAFSGNEKTT